MIVMRILYTIIGLIAVLTASLLLLSQYNYIDVYATANKDAMAKGAAFMILIAGLFLVFMSNYLFKTNKI